MNRRQFTTALSALAAAPAMPLKALTAAPAVSAAIPNGARFWAIYMSQLHGTCTAKTLSTMTGLDVTSAQGFLSRMIGDGVITPTQLVSKVMKTQANQSGQPSKFKKRMQKFVEEKRPATIHEFDEIDDQTTKDSAEIEPEVTSE